MDKEHNVKYSIFAVAIFCFAIYLYPVLLLLPGHNINTENRVLTGIPKFSFSEIKTFPKQFEAYFFDHIPFKSRITAINSYVKVYLMQTSPQNAVIIGKDNFLFYNSIYTGEGSDSAADYRGTGWYSDQQLQLFASNLTKVKKYVESKGIRFYFVIAPNKSSIYYEKMPDSMPRLSEISKADKLVEYLRENTEINVIYSKPALLKSKTDYLLYYKNDTHWNDLGGFLSTQELLLTIGKAAGSASLDDYTFSEEIVHGGKIEKKTDHLDLSNMLGLNGKVTDYNFDLNNYFPDRNYKTVSLGGMDIKTILPGQPGKALVYRDSFATAMIPYFSKHFAEVSYYWRDDISKSIIDENSPDVFVFECVERNLNKVLNLKFE